MKDRTPRAGSPLKLVAVAVALGVLAGAGAVYVMGPGSGNAPQQGGSSAVAKAAPGGSGCDAAKTVAASLRPFAGGDVAAMTPQDRPRQMGGLSFTDGDGKAMSLSDYRGKTLLVNVWATWCVPCRREMPTLDRLQAKRGGADFQVVAINVDTGDPQKPVAFLKAIDASHLALHRDASMGVFDDLKKEGLAFGLPVSLLIGKDGCLLADMNGPAEWDGKDAARLIGKAVDLQPDPSAPDPS